MLFNIYSFKNRPQNDLLCVWWDIKPHSLTSWKFLPIIYLNLIGNCFEYEFWVDQYWTLSSRHSQRAV